MNTKKFLSVILCIAMVLASISTVAFADGGVAVSTQEELATAISNATTETTIVLSDGNYTIPENNLANKNITFKGGKGAVIEMKQAINASNSTIRFEGIIADFGNDYLIGLQHIAALSWEDCTIRGRQTLYANDVTFTDCTFEHQQDYCIWTYGAKNITFTNCTFNTGGKAILVYNDNGASAGDFTADISIDSCAFNDDDTLSTDKGAVETGIAQGSQNKYNIKITNSQVNGFNVNNGVSNFYGNKNCMETDKLTITVDGEEKAVAEVGGKKYHTLAAAIEAANDGDTVKLLADVNIVLENPEDAAHWGVDLLNKSLTFDGNNKTITGLPAPLARKVTGGDFAVKNLTIKDADINTDSASAAALIGFYEGYNEDDLLDINNVNVIGGTMISTAGDGENEYAGGLVGYISATGTAKIANCSVKDVTLSATGSVGGIVGHANKVIIENTVVGGNTINTTGGKPEKVGVVAGTFNTNSDKKIDVTEETKSTSDSELNVIGRAYNALEITGGSYFTDPTVASATNADTEITFSTENGGAVQGADGKWGVYEDAASKPRTLTLSADKENIKAGETVTITLSYEGYTALALIRDTINFDPALFSCTDATSEGKIEAVFHVQDKEIKYGEKLASYTFTAKKQTSLKTGTFSITDAYTSTTDELNAATYIAPETNEEKVNIILDTYDVTVLVDGKAQTSETLDINFDGKGHKLEVVSTPEANKVEYIVYKAESDGTKTKLTGDLDKAVAPVITDKGNYEIEYTVTPKSGTGYEIKPGKFTLNITSPVHKTEVVNDFVDGKALVLVYTNVAESCFIYDGQPMVDVTASGYWFENETKYNYVFAMVVDGIADATVATYTDGKLTDDVRTACTVPVAAVYDCNVNCSADGKVDDYDLGVIYAVYNVRDAQFKYSYMTNILKCDINGDKTVDGHDIAKVINAVYPIN